jgi:cell division protease FtsH
MLPRVHRLYSIQALYAGIAAEEVLTGCRDKVSRGGAADVENATGELITYLNRGDGDRGPINYTAFQSNQANYELFIEASELSRRLYAETVAYLLKHRDVLDALAEALLEHETLYEDDVDAIIEREMKNARSES